MGARTSRMKRSISCIEVVLNSAPNAALDALLGGLDGSERAGAATFAAARLHLGVGHTTHAGEVDGDVEGSAPSSIHVAGKGACDDVDDFSFEKREFEVQCVRLCLE